MSTGAYREVHDRCTTDPQGYWGEVADGVTWIKRPSTALDESRVPFYRWFPDVGVLG